MSLAALLSTPCTVLIPRDSDEMTLTCDDVTFSVSRKQLVEDFAHFDELFREEKPSYPLPREYKYGWQTMFSNNECFLPRVSVLQSQLLECIKLTGSRFWAKVMVDSSDVTSNLSQLRLDETTLSLRTITRLQLERPVCSRIIEMIAGRQIALQVVDVRVFEKSKLSLDWFMPCSDLQELRIAKGGLEPFTNPAMFSSLRSVAFEGSRIYQGVLATIAALPALRSLNLQGSSLVSNEGLYALKSCLQLDALDLRDLKLEGRSIQLQANIHDLKRAFPSAMIVPEATLIDYTDFRDVLTTEKTQNSFGPEEGDSLTKTVLERLLDTNEQDQLQPQDYVRYGEKRSFYCGENFVSVDQNLLQTTRPLAASPIKLADKRRRIASSMPSDKIEPLTLSHFWSAVLELDISLIVAVKELEGCEGYIPLKKDEKVLFKAKDGTIFEVKCTSIEESSNGMTLRRVQVNGKEVAHLHKSLVDGAAMQGDELLEFLTNIERLEAEHPDSQTVIHCLQGVGRTGFTFACILVKELMRHAQPEVSYKLDLEKLLSGLRQQRKKMVLTLEQLKAIHGFFAYLYKKRGRT